MGLSCVKCFAPAQKACYICKQFATTLANGSVLNGKSCCVNMCVTFIIGVLGENFPWNFQDRIVLTWHATAVNAGLEVMISHDVIALSWHFSTLLFPPFFLSNFHSLKTDKYLCKLFSIVMISSFFVYTLTLSFPCSGETPENKNDIFQGKHLILLVCIW